MCTTRSNPKLLLVLFVSAVAPATSLRLTRQILQSGRRSAGGGGESQTAAVALNEISHGWTKFSRVRVDVFWGERDTVDQEEVVLKHSPEGFMDQLHECAKKIAEKYSDLEKAKYLTKVKHEINPWALGRNRGLTLTFKGEFTEWKRGRLEFKDHTLFVFEFAWAGDANDATKEVKDAAEWGQGLGSRLGDEFMDDVKRLLGLPVAELDADRQFSHIKVSVFVGEWDQVLQEKVVLQHAKRKNAFMDQLFACAAELAQKCGHDNLRYSTDDEMIMHKGLKVTVERKFKNKHPTVFVFEFTWAGFATRPGRAGAAVSSEQQGVSEGELWESHAKKPDKTQKTEDVAAVSGQQLGARLGEQFAEPLRRLALVPGEYLDAAMHQLFDELAPEKAGVAEEDASDIADWSSTSS